MKNVSTIVEVTLTTSNNSAYTANDQVGVAKEVPLAMLDSAGFGILESLVLVDKDAQKASIDIFFFDEQPTVASADNAAIDITDAEMVDKCIGYVNVPAASYVDLAASAVATVRDIQLRLRAKKSGSMSIWVVLATRGTPTYQSTSGLVLKLGIDQD